MARSVLLRLIDIRDSISGIESVIAENDFKDFNDSWAMQRAVERGLEIISESSRHLPDDIKALTPNIPWRQIAAIGNLLRHEYQRTDTRATWNITQEHLSPLGEAVDRLIAITQQREK
jgi:uncharacterized protein with HEPN domain